jgi:hypothetical protein
MKKYAYILSALLLAACIENKQREPQADSITQTTYKQEQPVAPAAKPAPAKNNQAEKIIRERAAGTVILYDAANGKPIAQVNDNVELEAGIPTKGWSSTLVYTEISGSQQEGQVLKKGSNIIVNGKPVGKLLEDVVVEMTFKNDKGVNTGTFHAAVAQEKLKAGTIIENALSSYLAEHPGRTLSDMQTFIRQFQLEPTDNNQPYKEYYNYESAADDPSPGYRTLLVFQQDKLIGVVGSRTMKLEGAKHYALDRDYHGYFFTDTDENTRKDYTKKFNAFVNSAD